MTDFGTLQQHHLLGKLLGLAREQAKALEAERIDQFLALMDEREELMSTLLQLEQAPAPANIVPLPRLTPAGSDADVKAAMGSLIRSIIEQDDQNERTLRLLMEALRAEMGQVNHLTAAGRGYAAALAYSRAGGGLDRSC